LATPIFFSETPCEYGAAGEPAGTHNRETLLDLGYEEEQIEDFKRKGLFS
jgi:crotonobetainyl-CoA:carnitine CoA-transferase CaiB-like acyl-CoA transferase